MSSHEQKCLPKGGWFAVPNGLVDNCQSLSDSAIRVYLAISRFARNRKAFPSVKTIMDRTGKSKMTVRRAINELVESHLLMVQHRKRPGLEADSTNVYYLLDPPGSPGITDETRSTSGDLSPGSPGITDETPGVSPVIPITRLTEQDLEEETWEPSDVRPVWIHRTVAIPYRRADP